jgi:hypothetical protein
MNAIYERLLPMYVLAWVLPVTHLPPSALPSMVAAQIRNAHMKPAIVLCFNHRTGLILDGQGKRVPLEDARRLYVAGEAVAGNMAFDTLAKRGFNIDAVRYARK